MTKTHTNRETASREIDRKIQGLDDWRGKTLGKLRELIRNADPEIIEAVKWRKPTNPAGVPVWEHSGIICTGDAFKEKVKITFAKGAFLDDPTGVFNAGLDGNTMRAVDLYEGDSIDEEAFQDLIRTAVAYNKSSKKG